MITAQSEMNVLIRPLHFADEGSATLFSVFQHCMNIESVQYYTIKPCPSSSAPLVKQNNVRMSKSVFLFVILSNECDNHLNIVIVRFNTALPKQGFVTQINVK